MYKSTFVGADVLDAQQHHHVHYSVKCATKSLKALKVRKCRQLLRTSLAKCQLKIRTCINPIADFICRQRDTKTSWRHVYLGRQISLWAGTMSPLVKVHCVAQVPHKVPFDSS